MKNILNNTLVLGMAIVMAFASCTKMETIELPQSVESTESTKGAEAKVEKMATLDVFFYNAYAENLDIVLKQVNYCIKHGTGEIEKTLLFDGEIVLTENAELVKEFDVKAGKPYTYKYIEYVYDAYQKVNGCCIAENDTVVAYLDKDACGEKVSNWEENEVYNYLFCPEFVEITFSPSVGNWD